MSNTCSNTLVLTGPGPDRDRFVVDVRAASERLFLEAHVPVGQGENARERWGTRGIKYRTTGRHSDTTTEFHFCTHWAPPYLWLEKVCAQFPTLTFELFFGCVEGAYGGYLRAEQSEVVVSESVKRNFAAFFAERGRPGFFVPYWEDEPGCV